MDFLFPKGVHYPPEFHIPPLTGTEILRVGPLSYTNSHFTMLLVGILLVTIAWLATRQKPFDSDELVRVVRRFAS